MRRILIGGAAVAAILAGRASGDPAPLAVQVNRAIDRGVVAVRTWQRPDGSFDAHYHASHPVGNTALLLYALLKSGVPPDDPQVRSALAYLRGRVPERTYSAAVLVMALEATRLPEHDPWIQETARRLEEGFDAEVGLWSYPGHHHDLSNTQYAVLGLWTAERRGYRAKTETWARLLTGVADLQKEDGGFAYRSDSTETGSMTTAGIAVLTLALERVPKESLRHRAARHRATKALERAWAYLDRRIALDANPHGAHAFTRENHHYYLFGLERVAAVGRRPTIGGRDWYREGARHLVATQDAKGMWLDSPSTCFALLFLRRATFTSLEGEAKPVEGEGVAAAPPAPAPPGADVPFVRRWLVIGPFEDPDDFGLYREHVPEAAVAPRPLASSAGRRWDAFRSLTDDVDLDRATAPGERKVVYAFTYLRLDADTDAVLWLGHDEDCRAWLDGDLVHDHHFHEVRPRDSVSLPVSLSSGSHRLLLKVANVVGAHGFSARVALRDGRPVPGLRPSLLPDGADLPETALAQPGFFPLGALLELLPLERSSVLDFRQEDEVRRVALANLYPRSVLWFPAAPEGEATEGPPPGAQGVLRLHPPGPSTPARVHWRVPLPKGARRLRARAAADVHYEHPGRVADGVLRLLVFDGTELRTIAEQVVGGHAASVAEGWVVVEGDVQPWAGRTVLVLVECANGGRTSWWAEDLYLDQLVVLSR